MSIAEVIAWKFNGAPGMSTDGFKITGWPISLGRRPTEAELIAFTAEYALVVSDLRATQDLQEKKIRAIIRWVANLHSLTNPNAVQQLRDIWKAL